MPIKNPNPLHPGVVLQNYYMTEMELTQSELARQIGCTPHRINEVIKGKRGISPQLAIELERVLGTTAIMWLRMQAEYDLAEARSEMAAHA